MNDFYKRFLADEVPKVTPGTAKQVFLAAFGKHPGWDDHVEDLGLETESLITTKMLLYVKGIGGEIDAGAWEKLDASQLLPAFKHVFIWQRGTQLIVGRLWASSDGKGRTRYPMVVCAHCAGLPLIWALEQVLPRLERLEETCVMTSAAADVRKALDQARAELRDAAARSPDTGTVPNGAVVRERFLKSAQFGDGHEGLLRVLYQMGSQFAPFAPGKFNLRADLSRLRPQHLRAPWGASTADQAILLWSQLLQTQVDAGVPVLVQVPLQDPWIDITVGEPTREEMFCLRATPKAVPLASEVPYNMDEAFRQAARATLDAFIEGRRSTASRKTELAAAAPVPDSARTSGTVGKLWKWLGGAGVIVVVAVALMLMKPAKEPAPSPSTKAAGTPVAVSAAPAAVPAPPTAPGPIPTPPPSTPPVTSEPAADPKAMVAAKAAAEAQAAAEAKAAAELAARREAERLKAQEQAKVEAAAKAEAMAKAEAAAKAEAERLLAAKQAEQKARETAAATAAPPTPTTPPATTGATPAAVAATVAPTAVTPTAVTPAAAGAAVATAPRLSPGSFTNSLGMVFVRMAQGYWVGQTEVTEAQFKKMMGPSLPVAAMGANHPVHEVSWNEATEFCRKLTESERQGGWLQRGFVYGLPTEAQWLEFVGDARLEDSITSVPPSKRTRPEPVGSTGRPNQYGLFDVRGNVWEWCAGTNAQKKARGGAYNGVTDRTIGLGASWPLGPDGRRQDIGFRCVMVPGA